MRRDLSIARRTGYLDLRTHWDGCAAVHQDCAALSLIGDQGPDSAKVTPGVALGERKPAEPEP